MSKHLSTGRACYRKITNRVPAVKLRLPLGVNMNFIAHMAHWFVNDYSFLLS